MPDEAARPIFYEQPLSERIRALLRLEFLFARAEHCLVTDDPWSSRAAIETINDIMAVMSRTDLKKELIKELDRHRATLAGLARNPRVDPERLESVLAHVNGTLSTLKTLEVTPGQELRDHELLSAVRQRSSIPAGTCEFDLPAFHFWLRSPGRERRQELTEWLSAFDTLREATALCLKLVRESAVATREMAFAGFFQKTLETAHPCQLIRVALPAEAECYPEISAGKHRFTVRFMRLADPAGRPTQVGEDVPFDLLCCVI